MTFVEPIGGVPLGKQLLSSSSDLQHSRRRSTPQSERSGHPDNVREGLHRYLPGFQLEALPMHIGIPPAGG